MKSTDPEAMLRVLKKRLAELVAAPSVSSTDPAIDQSNRKVSECLANWFEDAGCRVELRSVDEGGADKCNVIATLGDGPADESIVLSGHTDTVPCDPALWTTDPFELRERDGCWFGLGATDMKVFFPLALAAFERLDRKRMKRPLTVVATADEESSMSGARTLLREQGVRGRCCLIGEPTGLQPITRHKGVAMYAIEITGRSGHASQPALGNSALEGMHGVIGALLGWRDQLCARFDDARFEVRTPTLNLGCIHGGDNPNRICGHCALAIDLRLLPAMDPSGIEAELRACVAGALDGRGLAHEVKALMEPVPPFASVDGSAAVGLAERLSGRSAGTVAFATEGPFFAELGMETLVFGPGDIAVAHQPDEYVQVGRLAPMVDFLERFITELAT